MLRPQHALLLAVAARVILLVGGGFLIGAAFACWFERLFDACCQ